MNTLLHDLRHALHSLRAQPGLCLTAVLTLMLGIGALTAIFTVYDAVLLKPLPFAQVDRIVRITRVQPPVSGPISPAALREWRERSGSAFDAFGAFVEQTATLTGTGGAERVVGYRVTPGFWDVFSQPIALGRGISAEDEGAASVWWCSATACGATTLARTPTSSATTSSSTANPGA